MKKKKIRIICGAVLILAILIIHTLYFRVHIKSATSGVAKFDYSETDISEEDLSFIKKMFDGKSMIWDSPSCGFFESVSIKLGDKSTFCIANDLCSIIYYKEKNMYFGLTEKENTELRDMLVNKYGFHFPCI